MRPPSLNQRSSFWRGSLGYVQPDQIPNQPTTFERGTMSACLNTEQKRDLVTRGFARRNFGRIAAMIGAGAALPFYNEPALAQLSAIPGPMPPDAVKINANENPLGPCPEAAEAIHKIVQSGGRYLYEETFGFQETMAELEGLKPTYVQPYAGSSAPLHQAVLAFTSPSKPFLTADPEYEAGERAARFICAKVISVPLTKSYAHDVKAMAAASPDAGLIYVCNPNNPTGSRKFMVVCVRPGGQIIEAMRKEKIYIGRVWPSWPTYVRVSVGTQDEMNKFKTAFLKVMA